MKGVAASREARVALRDEDGEGLGHNHHVLAQVRDLLLGEDVPYGAVLVVVDFELCVLGEAERLGYALHADGDDLEAVPNLDHVAVAEHEGRRVELAHVGDEGGEGLAGKLLLGLHPLPPVTEELAEHELHVELGVVEPDARVLDGVEPRDKGGYVGAVGEHLGCIDPCRAPRPHTAVSGVGRGLEVARPQLKLLTHG